jgi:hypothetical protein
MRTRSSIALICVVAAGFGATVVTSALAARYSSETNSQTIEEFFVAADQVLQVMSKILDLPAK